MKSGFGAKISARGAKELIRICRERPVEDPDRLTSWEKRTLLLRSDGHVLEKDQVRFRSDGRLHDYGWKDAGRLKREWRDRLKMDPFSAASAWAALYGEKGYSRC